MVRYEIDRIKWDASSFERFLAPILESPAEIVRKIPGRLVARHRFDGRVFYAKNYFYGARSWKFFLRTPPSRAEWKMAPRLQALNIAVVPHHAHGELWSWRGLLESTLVTEGPPGFGPLNPTKVSAQIQTALGKFLRRLHDGAVFHSDLHPSNLLYSPATNEFCLVDLDNIQILPTIRIEQRINNLAKLQQRLPLSQEFYENYDPAFLPYRQKVAQRADEKFRKSIPGKLKLMFHRCVAYGPKKIHGLTWFVRNACWNEHLESLLKKPDKFLDLHSSGHSTGATVARADGFVLKRFESKKRMEFLAGLTRSSPARHAFRTSRHLELLKIGAPLSVAMAERRRFGKIVQSYLVIEAIPETAVLTSRAGNRRVILKRVSELLAKLHMEGFSHRNLGLAEVILRKNGDPIFINPGDIRYMKSIPDHRAVAELARFAEDARQHNAISKMEQLRFLKHYCATRRIADCRWWSNEIAKTQSKQKSLR